MYNNTFLAQNDSDSLYLEDPDKEDFSSKGAEFGCDMKRSRIHLGRFQKLIRTQLEANITVCHEVGIKSTGQSLMSLVVWLERVIQPTISLKCGHPECFFIRLLL